MGFGLEFGTEMRTRSAFPTLAQSFTRLLLVRIPLRVWKFARVLLGCVVPLRQMPNLEAKEVFMP
jgi:hypothetical protein